MVVVLWLALSAAGDVNGDDVVNTARTYLGYPYVYGDEGSYGFDCSGFVRAVYGSHGFALPRTSRHQSRIGEPVEFNDLHAGDLIFFTRSPSSHHVSHVGIATGDGRMIHASSGRGEVVIDPLTMRYWSRHRAEARRILGSPLTEFGTAASRDPDLREHVTTLPSTLGSSARPSLWHHAAVDLERRGSSLALKTAMAFSDSPETIWLVVPKLQVRWNSFDTEFGVQLPFAWNSAGERVLDFESSIDALRIFDRGRVGSPDADFYLEASRELSLNLGDGSLVDGVSPSITSGTLLAVPRNASLGVAASYRSSTARVSLATDDIVTPSVLGARLESGGPWRLGAEIAVDPNAPAKARFAGGALGAWDAIAESLYGLTLQAAAQVFDSDKPAPLVRSGLHMRFNPSPLNIEFDAEWRSYRSGAAPDLFGIDYRSQRDQEIWNRLDDDSQNAGWRQGVRLASLVSLTRRYALRAAVSLGTQQEDSVGQNQLEAGLIAREWQLTRELTAALSLAYHQRFVDSFKRPFSGGREELIFASTRLSHADGFSVNTQFAKRPADNGEGRFDFGVDIDYSYNF